MQPHQRGKDKGDNKERKRDGDKDSIGAVTDSKGTNQTYQPRSSAADTSSGSPPANPKVFV
eukprot:590922-Amphidinium_carterae.1